MTFRRLTRYPHHSDLSPPTKRRPAFPAPPVNANGIESANKPTHGEQVRRPMFFAASCCGPFPSGVSHGRW